MAYTSKDIEALRTNPWIDDSASAQLHERQMASFASTISSLSLAEKEQNDLKKEQV